MIFLVDTNAKHVLGVRIIETLTPHDVELAMSFLKKKIRTQNHIAVYVEIDGLRDVERGAILKELKHVFAQVLDLAHIDRLALVIEDDDADGGSIKAVGPVADVRIYSPLQKTAAKEWISQPLLAA